MSDIKKLNVQKKTAQQKGKKKKSDKSNRLVMAAVAVVVAAVVILGVFALSSDKVIKQSGTTSDNSELLSSVSTDEMGFPVTFTNNDIIRAESFSSRIFVLGKKIFTCLTDSGKVRYSRIFSFTQPEMTVSEKFGLVYDRASSKYFIFNRDGVIYEGETENKKHIITAKINNRGDVAFVTKSDDSACRVSLTDKKGKVLYIWSCAEEYGVSVDLSEDSREIVCGSIGSENGTVYSKVYLLSTYSDEDAQECRIDGSALVDIKLMGRKAVATCNNGRTVFTFRNSGVTQEHNDFSSDITAFYSDKSGNTAVVTNKVGYFGTKEITVYNKNNEITYIGYTDEEIVDVICRGKRAYLLTDKAIYESLSDGTFRVAGTKEISGEGMVICKGRLYYYSTGNIDINS